MIKDVLVPSVVGNYYLFPKRIIGFDITKTHVYATVINLSGTSATVEKFLEEKVETGDGIDNQEALSQAIKNIIAKAPKYDAIHSAINSSVVIFKEIKLPFTSSDKIRMVIDYEVGPMLPFALSECVLDFIITKELPQEESAEVMVAAVQNQHIIKHLQLFEAAGISSSIITVDLFALYGLFKQIPAYKNLHGGSALVDIGPTSTRIAYLDNEQLRFVRTIPNGLRAIAKTVSLALKVTPGQAMDSIIRFGMHNDEAPTYNQAMTQAVNNLLQAINFTLNSFTAQTSPQQTVDRIILLGDTTEIKGLPEFINHDLGIKTHYLSTTELLEDKSIVLKEATTIPRGFITSLSIALPSPICSDFTLRRKDFALPQTRKLAQQLVMATVLVIILFGTVIGHSWLQISQLQNEVQASEQEVVDELKEHFTKIDDDEIDITDVIDAAETELSEQERLWFAFSPAARASFLKYLLELTSVLDKDSLGLVVDTISITKDTIKLKARVKDYEALKLLERDLRQSALFAYVEPQDNPDFVMEIKLARRAKER